MDGQSGQRQVPSRGQRRGDRSESAGPPPDEPTGSAAARELALTIAAAGLDKKATGVEIIDVAAKVDYAEFLVLMSGRSDRHVHAIARGVADDLSRKGNKPLSVEGQSACAWVLIDFNDVVVHVFQHDARAYYDIEGLWIDAGRVAPPQDAGAASAAPSRGRGKR